MTAAIVICDDMESYWAAEIIRFTSEDSNDQQINQEVFLLRWLLILTTVQLPWIWHTGHTACFYSSEWEAAVVCCRTTFFGLRCSDTPWCLSAKWGTSITENNTARTQFQVYLQVGSSPWFLTGALCCFSIRTKTRISIRTKTRI